MHNAFSDLEHTFLRLGEQPEHVSEESMSFIIVQRVSEKSMSFVVLHKHSMFLKRACRL